MGSPYARDEPIRVSHVFGVLVAESLEEDSPSPRMPSSEWPSAAIDHSRCLNHRETAPLAPDRPPPPPAQPDVQREFPHHPDRDRDQGRPALQFGGGQNRKPWRPILVAGS